MRPDLVPEIPLDDDFPALAESVRVRFASLASVPLFRTDADGLADAFLAALPDELRQAYTCHACRHFMETYGGLVSITPDGATVPVMWPVESAMPFGRAVQGLHATVRRSAVVGVFLSSEAVWGRPVTGYWHHLAVEPPASLRFQRSPLRTPWQAMAEKTEEHAMLGRSIGEFSVETVRAAVTYLSSGQLYRSEKAESCAKWLLDLHERLGATKNQRSRSNILWLATATAPAGWCHVRSGVVGTLLEDIEAGLPFADIKRKWDTKLHPLAYQRPQAAPSAGNIEAAEKVVAALGIAASLRRRFARLSDVKALWLPKPIDVAPAEGGVFAHLKPGAKTSPIELPPVTMTWAKFRDTVLPTAETIECVVKYRDNFVALLTAADPDAPPILQWDHEDARNPVSWYVYNGGSEAYQWGLSTGWVPVTAITLKPADWNTERSQANQGSAVILLLHGARERHTGGGIGLFPECLKSSLHEIRSTIEAFSRSRQPEGAEEGDACGLMLQKGASWDCMLRIMSRGVRAAYRLDRWD